MKILLNIFLILILCNSCNLKAKQQKDEFTPQQLQYEIHHYNDPNLESELILEKINSRIEYFSSQNQEILNTKIEDGILIIETSSKFKEKSQLNKLLTNYKLSFAPIKELELQIIKEIKNEINGVSFNLCKDDDLPNTNLGCYLETDTTIILSTLEQIEEKYNLNFKWSLIERDQNDVLDLFPIQYGISEFKKIDNSNLLSVKQIDEDNFSTIQLEIDDELLGVFNNNLKKSIAVLLNNRVIFTPKLPEEPFINGIIDISGLSIVEAWGLYDALTIEYWPFELRAK